MFEFKKTDIREDFQQDIDAVLGDKNGDTFGDLQLFKILNPRIGMSFQAQHL